MKDKYHLLVLDPTAFAGGSKVATESILNLLAKHEFNISVLTADQKSWRGANIKTIPLYEPRWLAQQEQGISYFIRHAFIALNLLNIALRISRFDIAIGASGPGVDLALYLLRPFMKFNIIQLIHGPVATSRTIARCLKAAHQVHYLQSSYASLKMALSTLDTDSIEKLQHFHLLKNGLSEQNWPSSCQTHTPVFFLGGLTVKMERLRSITHGITKNARRKTPTHPYLLYIASRCATAYQ